AVQAAEEIGVHVGEPSLPVPDAHALEPPDLDVLRQIARGRGAQEIADELTVAAASGEHRIRMALEKVVARQGVPRAHGVAKAVASAPAHPLVIMFTDIEGSTA